MFPQLKTLREKKLKSSREEGILPPYCLRLKTETLIPARISSLQSSRIDFGLVNPHN